MSMLHFLQFQCSERFTGVYFNIATAIQEKQLVEAKMFKSGNEDQTQREDGNDKKSVHHC